MEPPITKKVVKFVNHKQEIGDVCHASSTFQIDNAGEKKSAMAIEINQNLIRTPVKFNNSRNSNKIKRTSNTSGDTINKLCKLSNNKKNIKNAMPDKLKSSNIPRFRPNKEGGKVIIKGMALENHNDNNLSANVESKVNLMIDSEICGQLKEQTTFVATTPPSLSYGKINGMMNTSDSESFADSFIDLNTIDSTNCLEIIKSENSCSSECTISSFVENSSMKESQKYVTGNKKKITITINGPPKCVNSFDIEKSSLIAATTRNHIAEEYNADKHIISSKDSYITGSTYGIDQEFPNHDRLMGDTSLNLVQQKINSAREFLESPTFSDDYAEYISVTSSSKSPTFSFGCSTGSQENRDSCYTKHSHHAKELSSKIEASSELLQNTTNLENIEVLEFKESSNNDAIQDNLSSGIMEASYENLDKDGCTTDWHNDASHSSHGFNHHINKEISSDILQNNYFNSDNCEREQTHKNFQIFNRFPGNRFRFPRILRSWPRRISIRRTHRKRLNRAKIDEPSNGWSTKMLILDRKIHVMHFLQIQKSSFLEDAIIQTGDSITNNTERQLSSGTKENRPQRYTGNREPFGNTNKRENSYDWNKEQSVYEVHNTHGLQYYDTENESSINNNPSNTYLEPIFREAFTEPIWTYTNTGTNVMSCGLQSDLCMTRGGTLNADYHTHFNIIYCKRCLSTEEAHVIVNSINPINKTDFCMVRKMKSVTTNTATDSQYESRYNDIETQKTPTISTDKFSCGVITSSYLLNDETNYVTASKARNKEGKRKETMSPFFYDEIQNQLSSFINQVYLNAVGLSPASSSGKETSDSSDICKNVELMKILPKLKRSSSFQTQPQLPKLITTEPVIVSVSSKLLAETCKSCAERKAKASHNQSNLSKEKCEMHKYSNKNFACQTNSAGGINSMIEAESLAHDIIKQVLINNGTEILPVACVLDDRIQKQILSNNLQGLCMVSTQTDITELNDVEINNTISDEDLDDMLANNEPNEIFEDASSILLKRSEKLLKDSLMSIEQSLNTDMIVKVLTPDRSTIECYNCKHKEIEKTDDMDAFMYHHKVTFDATTSGAEAETQHAVDHSDVAVITPFFGLLSDRMIREYLNAPLLSPEAYKELYETAKELVNEDINQPPERDTGSLSPHVINTKSAHKEHIEKPVAALLLGTNYTKDIGAVPLHYKLTSNSTARSRKRNVKAADASAQNEATAVKSAGIVTSMNSNPCFGRHCLCDNFAKSALCNPETKLYSSKHCHNSIIAMVRKKKTQEILGEITCETKDQKNCEAGIEDTNEIGVENVTLDEVKETLLSSCRYYSNLLTKQLNKVKNNITKILLLPGEEPCRMCRCKFTDACTSKPSGRGNLSCQTVRLCCPSARRHSRCSLSRSISITNICQHDREHLNSVYNILTGIDGRLRRLKMGVPN